MSIEQSCYFTSSRGIVRSCDLHNQKPKSSSDYIDVELLNNIENSKSIYLCTDSILNFSDNFLPKLSKPIVLVTGDSDTPIDQNIIQTAGVSRILNSPFISKWYAQNLNTTHEKLAPIPIGMDYHTMWEKPGLWGLHQQSAVAQERALIQIFANSPRFTDRYFAGYCNWHFAIDRGDRNECMQKIEKNICLIEKNHLPRISSWQRQAECMFVISPEGAGLDCHRTWEAILLGCVPVVKRSSFTKLLNNLPVVILDDWAEFNSNNMIKHVEILSNTKYDFSYLFTSYWKDQFNGSQNFKIEPMTLNEFKKFICVESH